MKKFITIIFLISLISPQANPNQTKTYHDNLYYTCRVWGFLKYYHSEVAKGNINWDEKLFDTIESLKSISTNEEFNQTILELVESAGDMAEPNNDPPVLPPEELSFNLDFKWIEDEVFSPEVKSELIKIKEWFRPRGNYYVGRFNDDPWSLNFGNDNQFYLEYINQIPPENYRLLTLFRYWNIIKYFNPYNNILDQDWDSTLVKFIPRFVTEPLEVNDYYKTILEFQTYINDTHGRTFCPAIDNNVYGSYYLPLVLKYIENETVVLRVLDEGIDLKPGDIIKSINGIETHKLRDSIRIYATASNESVIERVINSFLIRSPANINAAIVFQNKAGLHEISLSRLPSDIYQERINKETTKPWELIYKDKMSVGYINIGILENHQVRQMIREFWYTDALIIDCRNYPKAFYNYFIPFLFDDFFVNVIFTLPDVFFPGNLHWSELPPLGGGDFSETYNNHVILLFNEETQSSAEYNIMWFEAHPKAIKIGSQTAGADGNVAYTYLPGEIRLRFTGLGVFYADKTPTQRIGIVPDIEVHPTIEGIREGRDEVLEVALQQIVTSVDDDNHQIYSYNLTQNFPNPFNPTTTLTYELAERSFAQIKIYDILGREITTLVNEVQSPGKYQIEFEGGSLSSGIYIYKLITESYVQTRKMVLIK